jgi:hypothetical protein
MPVVFPLRKFGSLHNRREDLPMPATARRNTATMGIVTLPVVKPDGYTWTWMLPRHPIHPTAELDECWVANPLLV